MQKYIICLYVKMKIYTRQPIIVKSPSNDLRLFIKTACLVYLYKYLILSSYKF